MSTVTIARVDAARVPIRFAKQADEEVNGGVGGWETIDRPRREAAAGWVGTSEASMRVQLLLDGVDEFGVGRDRIVETDCQTLLRWGQEDTKLGEPPVLVITGLLVTPAGWRWVIQEIEWGERIRDPEGRRVQQDVTVTFLRHLSPTIVASPAKKSRRKRKKKGKGSGGGSSSGGSGSDRFEVLR